MAENLILYGSRLDAGRMSRSLSHLLRLNQQAQDRGGSATPICIWGTHGLGKTMLVEDLAKQLSWRFAYCAPAQFEEMGDLHGLPMITSGEARTRFAPPDWVPTGEGPGILLLDDLNRADDRILRGLMQLFQRGEMFSWSLPPRWQIVATANPEGGDYSVTPLDDAMLTRFLHLTLTFDARSWAAWATGAAVDPRGIAFVLCYPELVNHRRTTPRSLTQFFSQIRDIPDLLAERELVYILGMSALEESTVAAFLSFVSDNLPWLLSPEEILDQLSSEEIDRRMTAISGAGARGTRRVDRLGTICTRLYLYLCRADYRPDDGHGERLVHFLLHPSIPNDLRLSLHRDLIRDGAPGVTALLRDRRLAAFLLEQM
jgi:AAA domain (dynein-related subfamily)